MKTFFLEYPVMEYREALILQHSIVEAKKENRLTADVVLFLEHLPVFTLGKREGTENLIASDTVLKKQDIDVVHTGRGGSITWHGPGQLVVYPLVDLKRLGMGIAGYVRCLEEAMIRTARHFGIKADRNEKNRGVWVGVRKLGSVGIAVSRNITSHGLALNVNPDMAFFHMIHPCGLKNIEMTSLEKEIQRPLTVRDVRTVLKLELASVLTLEVEPSPDDTLNTLIHRQGDTSGKEHVVRKPAWLRRSLVQGDGYEGMRNHIRKKRLNTVCIEARCPNRFECFSDNTATFMILGDRCTRNCLFCNIEPGMAPPPDRDEPCRVSETAKELDLRYVVVTSVTRDDLPDGGATQFAATIRALRDTINHVAIEVLVPDFHGNRESLNIVMDAGPDIIGHNIETVERLYPLIRPETQYQRSLGVLSLLSQADRPFPVKSGLMLGLGETPQEIETTLSDVAKTGCNMVTIGQYLQPSKRHTPVRRYVTPAEFEFWKKNCLEMGFENVASGPLIRSSYRACDQYQAMDRKKLPGRMDDFASKS